MKLLNIDNAAKTKKGLKIGYSTAILYLAPGTLAPGCNTCAKASPGCLSGCLNTAGRGAMNSTQKARIRKTLFWKNSRTEFMAQLVREVRNHYRNATRKGYTPVVRLNGTSDIQWERIPVTRDGKKYPNIFRAFPRIQFYDYTKFIPAERGTIPGNYHLTFSRDETNETRAMEALRVGWRVAVVFAPDIPKTWKGYRVLNGDLHDVRPQDRNASIVGLTAKGKAKHDTTGFVVKG